jgi:drug/metabolite transporter superfamily protein YnfA
MPFGLYQVWRRHRRKAGALALAVLALAYPASFPFRLTKSGAEAANRSNEFLFIGIAFVLAVGIVDLALSNRYDWRKPAIVLAGAAVIFMGGVILGFAPWARLPGPYLVSADSRSIEPEGISAAQWARSSLGPENRMVADRTNALLMLSAGGQRPVTGYGDGIPTYRVVLSPKLGPRELSIIRQARLRYVVIDDRLAWALPTTGVYFERGEPDAVRYTFPLDPRDFSKFDLNPSISRIFDSGHIAIYDVGAFDGGS